MSLLTELSIQSNPDLIPLRRRHHPTPCPTGGNELTNMVETKTKYAPFGIFTNSTTIFENPESTILSEFKITPSRFSVDSTSTSNKFF